MDSPDIVIHTENICNIVAKNSFNKIELDETYRSYLNIVKEAKCVRLNHKKVGQPTLGKRKNVQQKEKKPGCTPWALKSISIC